MSNFSDYIKSGNASKTASTHKDNKTYSNEELQDMINKYSSFSEDKLLSEFVRLTLEKKSRGELKEKDLENMKSTIEPFLDVDQKNKLNKIIDMVRNVK